MMDTPMTVPDHGERADRSTEIDEKLWPTIERYFTTRAPREKVKRAREAVVEALTDILEEVCGE